LKKAANEVGPLRSKILQENHTIVKSRMMELRQKDFVNVAKKNIEREPGNAAFRLAGMCLSTTTCRINAVCLLSATSVNRTWKEFPKSEAQIRFKGQDYELSDWLF
jgi:hypothetical protein